MNKPMNPQKIIVMGGSFNPPTMAHFKLMESARQELNAERGIFVPASQPYLKRKMRKTSGRKILLSAEQRVEMLRAMCEGSPGLEVAEEEILVPERVTVETLPILQWKHPEAELLFLAGIDKTDLLEHWAKTGFLTQFHIALVCRGGTDPKQIIDGNPKLFPFRDTFRFITQPEGIDEISSTAIRQAFVERRLAKVRTFLHPAVWERFQTLTLHDFPPEIEKFQDEYAFLSNDFPCVFQWRNQRWHCSEAAIQAARCANPKDALSFRDSNAERAKSHAKKFKPRPDWEAVRLTLAEEILRAKFTQNRELSRKLRETSGSVLIFGTNDKNLFWGKDLYTDRGENQLGRLLMKIRDTITDTKRN